MQTFTIEALDTIKDKLIPLLNDFTKKRASTHYADLRIELSEERGAFCENGEAKYSGMDYGFSFGVRVLAGEDCISPGYFGLTLGKEALNRLESILETGLIHAYERAFLNARWKSHTKKRFAKLGESLWDMHLAPIEVCRDTIPPDFEINPLSISPQRISRFIADISKEIKALDSSIVYNQIAASTMLLREFFASSEGAALDQTFALTHGRDEAPHITRSPKTCLPPREIFRTGWSERSSRCGR